VVKTKLSNLFYSCLPFLALVLLWQTCTFLVGPNRCPGIVQTASVFIGSLFHEPIIEAQGGGSSGIYPHILATLTGFLRGLLLGGAAGFVIAFLMNQMKVIANLFEPSLEFFRALPPLLVIPFAIILCRSNDVLECFTVAIYSAFSVCVYTLNALKNVAPNFGYLATLLGAGRLRSLFDVQLPAIMPELLGGLRVTAALSLGIAVVVEYLAAPAGLGRVMKFAISYSRIDLIMASVIWVILIAVGVDFVIAVIFHIMLRWVKRGELHAL
jgi:ABC-type nitrate/sulfonate/bicarbonate transport system permease component